MPSYESTARFLGTINALLDKQNVDTQLEEDRAFQYAMEKFKRDADEKQQTNVIQLQHTMNQLQRLQTREDAYKDKLSNYMTMLSETESEKIRGIVQDDMGKVEQNYEAISKQSNDLQQLRNTLAMELTKTIGKVSEMEKIDARYNKGKSDVLLAQAIRDIGKKPGKNIIESQTLSDIEFTAAIQDPRLSKQMEAYKNDPIALLGLKTTTTELGKEDIENALLEMKYGTEIEYWKNRQQEQDKGGGMDMDLIKKLLDITTKAAEPTELYDKTIKTTTADSESGELTEETKRFPVFAPRTGSQDQMRLIKDALINMLSGSIGMQSEVPKYTPWQPEGPTR